MGKRYTRKKSRSKKGRNNQRKIVKIKDRFNPDFNTGFLPFLSNSQTLKNSSNSKLEKHCIIFNNTYCNMICKYLQLPSCPFKNSPEFFQTFYSNIKQLSLDINEFVCWTLLIDRYIKENSNGCDSKHLLYLAICSKMNLLDYSEIINEYKSNKDFQKWYNINKKLVEKGINLVEFNKRYNELRYNKNSIKIIKYNDIVNDLCKIFNKKNEKNKKDSNSIQSSNIINQNSSKNGEINIVIENSINIIDVNKVNKNYNNIISSQEVKNDNYKIWNILDILEKHQSDLKESSSKNEIEEDDNIFKFKIEGLSHNGMDMEEDYEKKVENKSFDMGENPSYLFDYNSNIYSFESLFVEKGNNLFQN